MTRKRLQDLVKEIDPLEQLDEDVEEVQLALEVIAVLGLMGSLFVLQVLMQMADDFIDTVVSQSCMLAKHRTSNALEVKDVQLHLGKASVHVLSLMSSL